MAESTQELLNRSARTSFQHGTHFNPATQPFPEAFHHLAHETRVLSQQRPRGLPVSLNENVIAVRSTALQHQVFEEIRARLSDRGVRIDDMTPVSFSFLLPSPDADANDWNDLLNNPIFVSDEQLSTMLNMRTSERITVALSADTIVFYCRTFTFYAEELMYLIQLLLEEYGNDVPEQVLAWQRLLSRLDIDQDSMTPVYIRYVGQTERTAWARHTQDLGSGTVTSGSFFATFLQICHNHFPEVLADAHVSEFDKAAINIPLRHTQRRTADYREQALIAELGSDTMLNTSRGGSDAVFQADVEDDRQFAAFSTRVLDNLDHATPIQFYDGLGQYARGVQLYTRDNPHTTNSIRYPITDEVRDFIFEQSIPTTFRGKALLVSIGSDLGAGSYDIMTPFYKGGVRSSALTCDVLKNLIHGELGYTTTTEFSVSELQSQRHLPFIDLFAWAKKDVQDLPDAMRLTRKYLHATDPMIILTFSELVTSVALSGFHGKDGIPRQSTMTNLTGTVHLAKYVEEPGVRDDNKCVIVIPCIHPGFLAHSSDNPTLMRMFSKTIAVAWLALHYAFQILREGGTSKRQMCEQIIKHVQTRTGPDTDFGQTLDGLRAMYTTELVTRTKKRLSASDVKYRRQIQRAEQVANSSKEVNLLQLADDMVSDTHAQIEWTKPNGPELPAAIMRAKKALEQLRLIIDCDIAQGQSGSEERNQQVTRLCEVYNAILNVKGVSNKSFRSQLEKVKRGELFYFSMTEIQHQKVDLPHLLSWFAKDPFEKEFLDDDTACKDVCRTLKDFISKNIVAGKASRHDSQTKVSTAFQKHLLQKHRNLSEIIHKLRRFEPFTTIPFVTSPHRVLIRTSQERKVGLLEFQWEHLGVLAEVTEFTVPFAATPIFPTEERFLSFTKDGVDITDASGRSLAVTFGQSVTIPLSNLITRLTGNSYGKAFLDLWERETGLTIAEVLHGGPSKAMSKVESQTITVYAWPETFLKQGKTRGLPTHAGGKTELAKIQSILTELENDPFQPSDAGWLVHKFLVDKYPTGGTVSLGSPDVWPGEPSLWLELRAFLEQPLYIHHPLKNSMLAECDKIRNVGRPGQGRGGSSDPGYQSVRGMFRLLSVLRQPATEMRVSKKTAGQTRSKVHVTVGGTMSLPNKVLAASIVEPSLVTVQESVSIVEGADDDLIEDVFEATAVEVQQQTEILKDIEKRHRGSKRAVAPDDVEMADEQVDDSADHTKVTKKSSKRAREGSSSPEASKSTTKAVRKPFGEVRRLASRSQILVWANKYDWDATTADDDDMVIIDEKVEVQVEGSDDDKQKKKKAVTGGRKSLPEVRKPSGTSGSSRLSLPKKRKPQS